MSFCYAENLHDASCKVLRVDRKTAKLFLNIGSGMGCSCSGLCTCQTQLNADNTWITIRRDGPVRQRSYYANFLPQAVVQNCPIYPGQLSWPVPTFILPCPNPPVTPIVPPVCGPFPELLFKYPPFVKYPLFSQHANELCFYFDCIFYDAPKGRYVADLFVDNEYCSSQKLNYIKSCTITSSSTSSFNRMPCGDFNPAPACVTTNCN